MGAAPVLGTIGMLCTRITGMGKGERVMVYCTAWVCSVCMREAVKENNNV